MALNNDENKENTYLEGNVEADGGLLGEEFLGDNLSDGGLPAGTSLLGETPEVSMAVSRALADSLAKITAYVPTTWVDNTEPDIDAEHLNHVEQGIMRVTNLMNSAVDVIKDLQTQVTTLNGETNQAIIKNLSISGTGETLPDMIKTIWNRLPAGIPFMGNFSGAGSYSFLGFIYPARNYGAIFSFGFTGKIYLVYMNNNVLYDKEIVSQ